MQTPEEILWKSSKKCCLEAVELANISSEFFNNLLKLSMSNREPFAHRAGWTMVYLAQKYPNRVRPVLRKVASNLDNIEHYSQVASFLRLFDILIFNLEEFGELLDFCLHTIRMPQKREYVKVIALNIILKFGKTYPELIPEIIEHVELSQKNFEMGHCKKKGIKILMELKAVSQRI